MPQPTQQTEHVNAALTQISVAYLQDQSFYIADKVFPAVPVEHMSDVYYVYSIADLMRDEAQQRADATESAGTGYNLATQTYTAKVWALHDDVGDQERANADPALDPEVDATQILMQKMLIRRDRQFMATYMTNGVWGTDVTGVASAPGGGQTIYWNDDANGDPISDIATAQTTILQSTGFEANTLLLAYPVYQGLRKHPLIIDRIKYTTEADARKITPALLAGVFDVERVLVSKAVFNSAGENLAASMGFISPKDALLCHVTKTPGLKRPSAGYIFPWKGFTGLNNMGVRVKSWYRRHLSATRVETEMSFDMQIVAGALGYHFSGIVQ